MITHIATVHKDSNLADRIDLWDIFKDAPVKCIQPQVVVGSVGLMTTDNDYLLAGSAMGMLIIDYKGMWKTLLPRSQVTATAVSSTKDLIALGCADGTVTVWQFYSDGRSPMKRFDVKRHSGVVTSLQIITGTGIVQLLVSGGTDQLIYSTDILDGKELQCCEGHTGDITCLSRANGPACLSGSGFRDGTARLWDLRLGAELAQCKMLDGAGIMSAMLVPQSLTAYIGTANGRVAKWDIANDTLTTIATGITGIRNIHIDQDETQLIAASIDDGVFVFDPKSMTITRRMPVGINLLAMAPFYEDPTPLIAKSEA